MFIDSHCHLTSLNRNRRQEVLQEAAQGYRLIDSSIDPNSSLASIALSDHFPFVYTALGFHPFSCDIFSQEIISTYQTLIDEHKGIIAIGEVGLDYKASLGVSVQEDVFSRFIRLAKGRNLPLCIHNRFEGTYVLDILDKFYSNYETVVFHCFSYGVDFLKRIVEGGGNVSFSLNVLRAKEDLRLALLECPLENMLLETDSPYMKIKGQESTPLDIERVYNYVSEIKNISLDELKMGILKNSERIFKF
jgi:TatD DNase family protein